MPRRIKSTELTSIKIDGQVFKAPTSWSLSRWAKYRDCPLWYRFDVEAIPERTVSVLRPSGQRPRCRSLEHLTIDLDRGQLRRLNSSWHAEPPSSRWTSRR